MSKAFTSESDGDDDDLQVDVPAQPAGFKNYVTPAGYARLNAELKRLWEDERPKLVETITWAASNGDRSENGDYIYGKRRLRQIDSRIRFLSKRLDNAEVVEDEDGKKQTVSIVGIDELDPLRGRVSWISPIAKALMKAHVGDTVTLRTPKGNEQLEVVSIRYEKLD
jgi:transcription elongation factor GreB